MVNTRKLRPLLLERLTYFSAVALLGPRQCGATTLARGVADKLAERAIYLDLRAYLAQVIEHDVAFFLRRLLPGPTLRRLWAMIAVEQGGLLNSAKLAQNLSVSSQSITRYLALFVELMHLRALQSWRGNVGKRLTKPTKYFVRASGLLYALL